MGKFVTPKVYLVGKTVMDLIGLRAYLDDTGNEEFLREIEKALGRGLSGAEILCSFFAKLCYASLTVGKNDNITKVRDVWDNLVATFDSGHGSVFEHAQLNFVVTNCSRVYTHEQVRHRVGTAYSQTSGRYVRGDEINLVFDPILEPVRDHIETLLSYTEDAYNRMVRLMDLDNMKDFSQKKKITSALRRILPNGQSNEMGMSLNLRTLRHTVMVRTSRHAEWEIRQIYGQVYQIVKEMMPLAFHGAQEEMIDNVPEVTGMVLQPYEARL